MHTMLTNAVRRMEELAGYPNHSGSTGVFQGREEGEDRIPKGKL